MRWAGDACAAPVHTPLLSPGVKQLLQSSAHSQGPRRERIPPAASDAHISATEDADQACGQIRAFQSPFPRCISASEVPFCPLTGETWRAGA